MYPIFQYSVRIVRDDKEIIDFVSCVSMTNRYCSTIYFIIYTSFSNCGIVILEFRTPFRSFIVFHAYADRIVRSTWDMNHMLPDQIVYYTFCVWIGSQPQHLSYAYIFPLFRHFSMYEKEIYYIFRFCLALLCLYMFLCLKVFVSCYKVILYVHF